MDDYDANSGWDDSQSVSGHSITPSVMGYLASGSKKISDAITFGPKFCEVFHMFVDEVSLREPINLHRHLFDLCVDSLVDFVKWVRRDDMTIAEVTNMLFNAAYLRPETRNGVVITLIYVFSSMKATVMNNNMDMFSVLVNEEFGLGIANRFSLKIYNDPFNYLNFLKLSVSALIDCGVVPENDRINNNKIVKPRPVNTVELNCFLQIKEKIVTALRANDNDESRRIVGIVVDLWQDRKKIVARGHQFSAAWAAVQAAYATPALEETPSALASHALLAMSHSSEALNSDSLAAEQPHTLQRSGTGVVNQSISSSTPESVLSKRRLSAVDDGLDMVDRASSIHHNSSSSTSRRPISPTASNQLSRLSTYALPSIAQIARVQALRFTRIGQVQWMISQYAVYDAESLLSMLLTKETHCALRVFLIDSHPADSPILAINSTYAHRVDHDKPPHSRRQLIGHSLHDMFVAEHVYVTEWTVDDPQFLLFWSMITSSPSRDLIRLWKDPHTAIAATGSNWKAIMKQKALSDLEREEEEEEDNENEFEDESSPEEDVRNEFQERNGEKNRRSLSKRARREVSRGYLAIEVDLKMILCIRRCEGFPVAGEGLSSSTRAMEEDLWCYIYPQQLVAVEESMSLGDYFVSLFPQLRRWLSATAVAYEDIVVKYKATALGEQMTLPTWNSREALETLACCDSPAAKIFRSRLPQHSVCHNFILRALN